MASARTSRVGRTIARVKELAAELDYAQRRLLEIRTGIPFTTPAERLGTDEPIDELEELYASADAHEPASDAFGR